MKTRRIFVTASLLCLAIAVFFLVRERLATAAQPPTHEITLADGQKASGIIMQLRPTSYLLQGTDRCFVFSEDEIKSIDGKGVGYPRVPVAESVPLTFETLEKIQPDGRIEGRFHFRTRNTGSTVLTELNWGVAPHEIAELEHYRVLDEFGLELPMRVEDDPSIKGKRVFVTLLRPALPGDEIRITMVIQEPGAIRSGEDWIYRNEADYPDKRLVTRSILLPKGARILSAMPEPLYQTVSSEGPVVVWRRYFAAGERTPWEIRYHL
jgi:hypothetical protein